MCKRKKAGGCMFAEKRETAKALLPYDHKLRNAWCRESCSPSLRENWPNGSVARGQCFVTAVAGEVFELHISEEETHYYNMIDGEIVDLSSEQFGEHITSDFYLAGVPSDLSLRMGDLIKKK